MTDLTFALLVLAFAAAAWIAWGLVSAVRAETRLAGVRLVTCPETGERAAVVFDRLHGALTAFVHGEPEAQLADCSRWAVHGGCEQPCVPEALSPDRSTSHIVARWAAGKRCVYCRKTLDDVEAPIVGHHVALLGSDRVTTEWPDVPPTDLVDALESRAPVCWNCHVVETFRRVHPELVTDR